VPPASPELRALAERLLPELDLLAASEDPDEPNALEAIWATAPAAVELPGAPSTSLLDRIHGGWLGRASGCLLGKPVEKTPRQGIREILEATGRWPLRGYFTAAGLPDDVAGRWPWNRASRATSLADVIDGMPEDDDLNYTLLALRMLEQHGPELSSDDVATQWLLDLPAGRTFTAERVAYRNLLAGISPPRSASVTNPYREWIGAAIRGDCYGWACPGRPRRAADLAWRDARVSHTRNGSYGAMYVAAMASAAVVCSNIDEVLDAGLSVIPVRSRLAEAVRHARDVAAAETDFERAVDRIYAAHARRHWVHVLNNVALSTLALAWSKGDFAQAICLVVSGGWDTDSNGATVGAVTGALAGARALPAEWIDPLRNRIDTSIPGFAATGFDELARRTAVLSTDA
jgi:ADP-ribosylglycohydrolase